MLHRVWSQCVLHKLQNFYKNDLKIRPQIGETIFTTHIVIVKFFIRHLVFVFVVIFIPQYIPFELKDFRVGTKWHSNANVAVSSFIFLIYWVFWFCFSSYKIIEHKLTPSAFVSEGTTEGIKIGVVEKKNL